MSDVLKTVGGLSLVAFITCGVCTQAGVEGVQKAQEQREVAKVEKAQAAASCANQTAAVQAMEVAAIAAAMDENEARVQAGWKGKCVKVRGIVAGIDSDFMDKPIVKLGTGKRFEIHTIMCHPANEALALQLSKGQELVVTGVGGDEIMGSLALDECAW